MWILFFGSFLCIYRGFLKFKVQNGNTLFRHLNLKYFLGMSDIPDIFWCGGGGGGGNSRCLVLAYVANKIESSPTPSPLRPWKDTSFSDK